jgi:hypothetical protein
MEDKTNLEPVVRESVWKKHFMTVTPLSKFIALYLFIMLPIVGFWAGYAYAPATIVGVAPVTNRVTQDYGNGGVTPLPVSDFPSPSPVSFDTTNDLVIAPSVGEAPLTVTLSAPEPIMKKINDCRYQSGWYGASGNGLSVVWGDNGIYDEPQISFLADREGLEGTSCVDRVSQHTYTEPGTYTVRVTSWYPGPTDAPITEWTGVGTVVVE